MNRVTSVLLALAIFTLVPMSASAKLAPKPGFDVPRYEVELPEPVVVSDCWDSTSNTWVPHPIIDSMLEAWEQLDPNGEWVVSNDCQGFFYNTQFLTGYYDFKNAIGLERDVPGATTEAINAELRNGDYDIQISSPGRGEMAAAVVMDLQIEWKTSGVVTSVRSSDLEIDFPAVQMSASEVEIYELPDMSDPVFSLTTSNGDRVFFMAATFIAEPHALVIADAVRMIQANRVQTTMEMDFVFPMVNMNEVSDLDWMNGFRFVSSAGFEIAYSQILAQNRFRMDESGATATEESEKDSSASYTLDQSFLVWVERENASLPVFVAYVDESNWADPSPESEIGEMSIHEILDVAKEALGAPDAPETEEEIVNPILEDDYAPSRNDIMGGEIERLQEKARKSRDQLERLRKK